MPTYEYKCTECGERFEVFQQMTDDPLTTCSQCAGSLKRLIGAGAGIIFKGSGFYCTDYRNDNGGAKASETPKTESATESTASKEPAKKAETSTSKKESANV